MKKEEKRKGVIRENETRQRNRKKENYEKVRTIRGKRQEEQR